MAFVDGNLDRIGLPKRRWAGDRPSSLGVFRNSMSPDKKESERISVDVDRTNFFNSFTLDSANPLDFGYSGDEGSL